MLVSHDREFIFLKTFKTASTSVEMYFEPYCVEPGRAVAERRSLSVTSHGIATSRLVKQSRDSWWNHMPAHEVRDRLGAAKWSRYFRFCTARNPYDQLVSAFYFYERTSLIRSRSVDEQIERFREWAPSGVESLPAHHFLLDGNVCVDQFIRYECLNDDLAEICASLGLPFEPERLPQTKGGYREPTIPLEAFFDTSTAQLTEKALRSHFEAFGYPRF